MSRPLGFKSAADDGADDILIMSEQLHGRLRSVCVVDCKRLSQLAIAIADIFILWDETCLKSVKVVFD